MEPIMSEAVREDVVPRSRFVLMLALVSAALLGHLLLDSVGQRLFFAPEGCLTLAPGRFHDAAGEDLTVRESRPGEPLRFTYAARIDAGELAAAGLPSEGLLQVMVFGLKAEGYQVLLNGRLLGAVGDVEDGRSDCWNSLGSFPVPAADLLPGSSLQIRLRGELARGLAGGMPVVVAGPRRAALMAAFSAFVIQGFPIGAMTLLLAMAFVGVFGRLEWDARSTGLFVACALCFAVYLTDYLYLPRVPMSHFTLWRIQAGALYAGSVLVSLQILLMLRCPWPLFAPTALLALFWVLGIAVSADLRAFHPWYTAAFWTYPPFYAYLFVVAVARTRGRPESRTLIIVVVALALPGAQLIVNNVLREGRQVLQAGYLHSAGVVLFMYATYQEYRRAQWDQLRRREQERETLNRVVRNLNHDVGNILTSVQAPLDLLGLTRLEPAQESYRRAAGRAVDEIHLLLAGLLALREAQAREAPAGPVEVDAFLDELVEVNGVTASRRGVDLFCRIGPQVPRWLPVDVDRLRIVMMNLVGNALKFTPAGWVLIQAEWSAAAAGVLALRVTDTGPGIPEAERQRIFADGYRVASGAGAAIPGEGVGLSICAHLAREAGWRLGVAVGDAGGTAFTLDIPCGADQAAPTGSAEPECPAEPSPGPDAPLLCCIGDDEPRTSVLAAMARRIGVFAVTVRHDAPLPRHPSCVYLMDEGSPLLEAERMESVVRVPVHVMTGLERGHRLPRIQGTDGIDLVIPVTKPLTHAALRELCRGPGAPAAEPPVRFFGRVVLADDDYAICAILEELLQRMGLDVVSCRHGGEALEAMAGGDFDVVILDQNMPFVDGLETARRIRALPDGRGDTFIIGMVGSAAREDSQRAIRSGMDWIVTKPVHREDLQRALLQADLPHAPWDEERAGSSPAAPLWGPPRWMELSAQTRAKVLAALREQAPRLTEAVRGALGRGDWREIDRQAHQLQNWFNNVGVPGADRMLRRLEAERRAGEPEKARAAASRLIRALPLVLELLSAQAALEETLDAGAAGPA
jgi:signal transduction histidine kinase/ActR/RegA family two-component response regulator